MPIARLSFQALCGAVLLLSSACDPLLDFTGPGDEVATVGITLGFPGFTSGAFLTLGDRDTVRAQAYTDGWPSHTKYDSSSEPRRFQYLSSNPGVASVDLDGVVTTLSIGTTKLAASVDGVTSPVLSLNISPPASALIAEPTTITTRVGDTFAVSIDALNRDGQYVPDIVVIVGLDTTYWALTSMPFEGNWVRTPVVLHFQAKAVGRLQLIATVQNERDSSRFQVIVPVEIRAP